MFERFNDGARRVMVLAQDEARLLRHNYVGTEHILLGLAADTDDVARLALDSMGVTLEALRQQVDAIVGPELKADVRPGPIPFTPRAKRVLELSLREALQLGSNYIGTGHILLGLLREGQGVAVQVLIRLGCDPQILRRKVVALSRRSEIDQEDLLPAGAARLMSNSEAMAALQSISDRLARIEAHLGIEPDSTGPGQTGSEGSSSGGETIPGEAGWAPE